MKTTRRYRAVRPQGVAKSEFDAPKGFVPYWDETKDMTVDMIRGYRDEFFPGYVLEVEETVIHDWCPVENVSTEDFFPKPGDLVSKRLADGSIQTSTYTEEDEEWDGG